MMDAEAGRCWNILPSLSALTSEEPRDWDQGAAFNGAARVEGLPLPCSRSFAPTQVGMWVAYILEHQTASGWLGPVTAPFAFRSVRRACF